MYFKFLLNYITLVYWVIVPTVFNLTFFPAVCLRIQINPQNKGDFLSISPERAFADFLFAHTVLHLVVMNFIGWIDISAPPLEGVNSTHLFIVTIYIYLVSYLKNIHEIFLLGWGSFWKVSRSTRMLLSTVMWSTSHLDVASSPRVNNECSFILKYAIKWNTILCFGLCQSHPPSLPGHCLFLNTTYPDCKCDKEDLRLISSREIHTIPNIAFALPENDVIKFSFTPGDGFKGHSVFLFHVT